MAEMGLSRKLLDEPELGGAIERRGGRDMGCSPMVAYVLAAM